MTTRGTMLSCAVLLALAGMTSAQQVASPEPSAQELFAQIKAWCEANYPPPDYQFQYSAGDLANGTIDCFTSNHAVLQQQCGSNYAKWTPSAYHVAKIVAMTERSPTAFEQDRAREPAAYHTLVNAKPALIEVSPGSNPSVLAKVTWWCKYRRVYLTLTVNEEDTPQSRQAIRDRALAEAASLDACLDGQQKPKISCVVLVDVAGALGTSAAMQELSARLVRMAEGVERNNEYLRKPGTFATLPPAEWALMTYDETDVNIEHDFTMKASDTRQAVAQMMARLSLGNAPAAPAIPQSERLAKAVARALIYGYLNGQAPPYVMTMTCGDKPAITPLAATRLKRWLERARTAYHAALPAPTGERQAEAGPGLGLLPGLLWAGLAAPGRLGSPNDTLDDLMTQLEVAAAVAQRRPSLGIIGVAVPPGSEQEGLLQSLCSTGGGRYVAAASVQDLPEDLLAATGVASPTTAPATGPAAATGPAVTLPTLPTTGPLPDPAAALTNVALGKPAQQSSRSRISRPDDPQGAVDGVKNGKFGFHTDWEVHPWWQVDLGQPYALRQVVIYNCLEYAERAQHVEVTLSQDGQTWQSVYTHQGGPFGGVDGRALTVPLSGLTARYVRLRLADDAPHYLHLDEVEVYAAVPASAPATATGPAPLTLPTLPATTTAPRTPTGATDEVNVPSLGFRLGRRQGQLTVLQVQPGSLAELAGLQTGDHVLVINDTDTTGLSAQQVQAMTDVPIGTRVSIRYRRPDTGFSGDFTLQRR